jgi:DNA topoisomerase VI subunit B
MDAAYFNANELQKQTEKPVYKFGKVVLKELIDNASDTCKNAGINPVIEIGMAATKNKMRISVSNNGRGINEEVIMNILNFNTRTSD